MNPDIVGPLIGGAILAGLLPAAWALSEILWGWLRGRDKYQVLGPSYYAEKSWLLWTAYKAGRKSRKKSDAKAKRGPKPSTRRKAARRLADWGEQ